jgi:ATP-dependent Lon protease
MSKQKPPSMGTGFTGIAGTPGQHTASEAEPKSAGLIEPDSAAVQPRPLPEIIPVLPIKDAVLFPGTVMPVSITRAASHEVVHAALRHDRPLAAVAQRNSDTRDPILEDLYRVGCACSVLKVYKRENGVETAILHGICRVGLESACRDGLHLSARVHAHHDPTDVSPELEALMQTVRTAALRVMELSPNVPEEVPLVLEGMRAPGALADYLAANTALDIVHRQELLETFDVRARLEKAHVAVAAQREVLELSSRINDQVRSQMNRTQREYYLREQMKVIRNELGDRDGRGELIERLRGAVAEARMPETVEAEANRELDRLQHIPLSSPEYSLTVDYLEWLAALPWSVQTEDQLNLTHAAQVLDEDHHGLEKVKRRMLEFLAVRQLSQRSQGPILCLSGPPGVGKTSLGRSIARALDRKFARLALGGVRDEATIRGHRRTYIGALPGNLVQALRKAGTRNPVIMLDEVDKLGSDSRGDPMSALLEVLDPAQNHQFTDHYLNVPFDLSDVLFIATANTLQLVAPPLRDRMEVIELGAYTESEKIAIAQRYLLPRQRENCGLATDDAIFDDNIIRHVVGRYTREAGVRELERKLGAVIRRRAADQVRDREAVEQSKKTNRKRNGTAPTSSNKKPDNATNRQTTREEVEAALGPPRFDRESVAGSALPGIVTGLAYTASGGDILYIEAAAMPGNGQLRLTGHLGEVMRESAWAAHSIVRGRAEQLGVGTEQLARADLHVHVPAGAIPKDGPSAGVAMLTAMTSIITQQEVDPELGMTGEITLSGRVLPVGGVREKVLAGHRAGLRTLILPSRNEQDLHEVPAEVRAELRFIFVDSIDDLLGVVFEGDSPQETGSRRKEKAAANSDQPANHHRRTMTRRSRSESEDADSTISPAQRTRAKAKRKSTATATTKRTPAKTTKTKPQGRKPSRKRTSKPAASKTRARVQGE